jgi:hypothetical protein
MTFKQQGRHLITFQFVQKINLALHTNPYLFCLAPKKKAPELTPRSLT